MKDMKYHLAFKPRVELISKIPSGCKKILDVGVSAGENGRFIEENNLPFDTIVGIEVNPSAAEMAKKYYDNLLVGDVEDLELPYPDGFFDCIIYGGVLEHLVDPWSVLKKHRKKLHPEGVVIASIPNVRFYEVVLDLVFKGDWRYSEAGILDSSHLRFFTLKTIKEMFHSCGYKITHIETKIVAKRKYRRLNRILFGLLKPFLVWQYFIVAQKNE